jgi:hypothetical protein
MAATLSLDTLTSGGSGITVLAGKTLTVEGVSVTAGSTNVQRATTDVTIGTTAGYEVAGKSEVVVAANAASSNRTITLPAVGAVGMSTCIITVVADADATSTYALKVQDAGTAEVWTGYQKGDFVRLIVSNSVWVVVDHKETYYSYRYLTADQIVAHSSTTKLTGWTLITEIGNTWDNPNDKLTTPTGMNGYWTLYHCNTENVNYNSVVPVIYVNGAAVDKFNQGGPWAQGYHHGVSHASGKYYATSTQDVEWYGSNIMNSAAYGSTGTFGGGSAVATHFIAQFERVY